MSCAFVCLARRAEWGAVERVLVPIPNNAPPLPGGFDALQLMNPNRGLQIHHVVFETSLDDTVMLVALVAKATPGIFGHAVQRQDLDLFHGFNGISDHHATLAGSDIFRNVEAETTEFAKRPGFLQTFYCGTGFL